MPTRGEIQEDIVRRKSTSQDDVRRKYIAELSNHTGRDTIVYASYTEEELERTRQAWEEWSHSPAAFLAFAWCRVLGRKRARRPPGGPRC
jgi:hypothetical protein